MLLSKKTGGATVAGITWEHDGDVEQVPDDLAHKLLAIKGGGYEEVHETPKPAAAPSKPAAK
jgi:hypothetical protein